MEQKGLTATLHFRRVDLCGHVPLIRSARDSLRAFRSQIALRVGKCALKDRTKVPRCLMDKTETMSLDLHAVIPGENHI